MLHLVREGQIGRPLVLPDFGGYAPSWPESTEDSSVLWGHQGGHLRPFYIVVGVGCFGLCSPMAHQQYR